MGQDIRLTVVTSGVYGKTTFWIDTQASWGDVTINEIEEDLQGFLVNMVIC